MRHIRRSIFIIFVAVCVVLSVFVRMSAKVSAADALAGDVDGNGTVDINDVTYLYYHYTMDANDYPINSGLNVDYDNNGKKNKDDATYLLYHLLFRDMNKNKYPLNASNKGSIGDDWTPDVI